MLDIQDLNVHYGHIHALKAVSLQVAKNEIVTLIGSNGAGKSTTLNAIAGLVHISSGHILYKGEEITGLAAHKVVARGISMSPEGREVFSALTVEENLRLGAYTRRNKSEIEEGFQRVLDLFPRLKERMKQLAGTLSGGEQQMLAIGRALMASPELLLLDEPSMGLAPNLVMLIFDLIESVREQGVTILLIEQNANMSLSIADRAYVLETGNVVLSGKAQELADDPRVKKAYLGSD